MPLDEEGAKWSWGLWFSEPCIRGHRSSKCQHFDRLMMKVPKAGRPLAKCPHPKGTCSCQKVYAFMVRIPKGSTCLCRPLYQVPMPGSESGQSPGKASPKSSPSISAAPSSTGAAPNRVQKRTRRQNSIQSTSELVAKGLAALAEATETPKAETMKPLTPYTPVHASIAPSSCHVPIAPSSVYQRKPVPVTEHDARGPFPTPIPRPYNFSESNFARGACCSSQALPQPIPSCPAPCCSKTNLEGNSINAQRHAAQTADPPNIYPSAQETHAYSTFGPNSPVLRRPPSVLPKIESADGRMFHLSDAATMPMAAFPAQFPLSNAPYCSSYPSQNHIEHLHSPPHLVPGSTSPNPANYFGQECQPGHNCGCGDGCQCLGCASHPFNDTTRHHIQEMGYMMALENNDDADNQPTSPYSTNGFTVPFEAYHHQGSGLIQNNTHGNFIDDLGNQSAQSLSNGASLPSPRGFRAENYELLMQPTAYYTLEYPVGMPDLALCSNIMGTCQCGINCKCIGCLTHDGHNGVPLEPSPPPDRPAESLTLLPDKPMDQTQPEFGSAESSVLNDRELIELPQNRAI
ncbi:predicted protein [Uncinocarpus reesii 1704]|uniref:Copper-fist domain-containing protein n=1 Tax=Uncinocarpus reesii (strain UAMH 1704) TaxID=336963 RepID=C4JNU5_UNCRE|nr:uncharacterized protein UREG_04415 [Uncinocarpus reesii 1704]EEP79569.1 predicted protein [Uncinocarpus reesii 1704]